MPRNFNCSFENLAILIVLLHFWRTLFILFFPCFHLKIVITNFSSRDCYYHCSQQTYSDVLIQWAIGLKFIRIVIIINVYGAKNYKIILNVERSSMAIQVWLLRVIYMRFGHIQIMPFIKVKRPSLVVVPID